MPSEVIASPGVVSPSGVRPRPLELHEQQKACDASKVLEYCFMMVG